MKYIRMFIAGIAFPSTLLPFLFLIAFLSGKTSIVSIPFFHFIPLMWGIWNVLYFTLFFKILPGNSMVRLLITGAVLGVLIAAYGVFELDLPKLMGFPKPFMNAPLIIAPVIYAIFWLFIVSPINRLLGIHEKHK